MSEYSISKIYSHDKRSNQQIDELLIQEGIRRDKNLDYTCGMCDENYNIIATGSCFGNTLRCLAVSNMHQGEGLMNEIVTHLVDYQAARNNFHLFMYTKLNTAKFFSDLGFYEIAKVENHLIFMENKRNGFNSYLEKLKNNNQDELAGKENRKVAALVMNANPFTLGHQYLIEKTCAENDFVHLFVVSEDASLVPFNIRKRLIKAGTAHIKNIQYHDSGAYIISNATFPSYFQKDESSVIEGHAELDVRIFSKIAKVLGINRRYVGDEPTSIVTNMYNQTMARVLPENDIECVINKRKEIEDKVISASTVRNALKDGDLELFKSMVPQTTYDFFMSDEAKPILEKIKNSQNVIHY